MIELSQSSRIQTADGPSKPRTTSFFPLRKVKGNQPLSKKPAVCLAQLGEEEADDGEDLESELNGKEGMAIMKGAWAFLTTMNTTKSPLKEAQEA